MPVATAVSATGLRRFPDACAPSNTDLSMTDRLRQQLQASLGSGLVLGRELGTGGMSRVFLVSDSALRRELVVKLLPPELTGDLSLDRFQREIRLAARLQHPHIVPLLNTGDAAGVPWFTMPYIEGSSLRERLSRDGELPVGEAVRLLREIASALAYAHGKGIVHRDLKPENVLLTGGIALLADFGVAKAVIEATTVGSRPITAAGLAVGTPAYMSPEQISADPSLDARSDIYAFGVLAYEILSGTAPFNARTTQALLAAHLVETPESIAVRRPAVPPQLAVLVMRCLEKRPSDRPQDVNEVMTALDALTTPSAVTASSAPRTRANSRNRRIAVSLASVAAIAAVWFGVRNAARGAAVPSTRVLITPFENLTGDERFEFIGRVAADRLARRVAQVGSNDVVPSTTVMLALHDTTGDRARQLQRLSVATNAGLIVSGSVVLRGDSLMVQSQVTDAKTGATVVTLDPASGPTSDPVAAVDALGDRLLGALGRRADLQVLPEGFRAPKYTAYREFATGFELFTRHDDNRGSRPFFERAIAIDSSYAQAYFLLARQYMRAGEFGRADSLLTRFERLPGVLSATERIQLAFYRAELTGDLAGRLRNAELLVAVDSAGVSQWQVGRVAVDLLRPAYALRVLQSAESTFALIGGFSTRNHVAMLGEAQHLLGDFGKERQLFVERGSVFASDIVVRGRLIRAYAGLRQPSAALAMADSMMLGRVDTTGAAASHLVRGAMEFAAHGDAQTAQQLLTRASRWYQARSGPAGNYVSSLDAAVTMLLTNDLDGATIRLQSLARDTTRIDALGWSALAHVARGNRADAESIATSLTKLRRPWLFGTNTYWRAAISGALGNRDLAVQLLEQAHREGVPMHSWHYAAELAPLRGFAPFDALLRPRP